MPYQILPRYYITTMCATRKTNAVHLESSPGVWEVPMVMWQDLNGGRCSMGDGCSNPPDAEGVYKMLIKNFERHYTTNRCALTYPLIIRDTFFLSEFCHLFYRAPFPLYYHAAWFTTAHHKEGFEAFLDTIVSMDDVWLVTNWQAIQWVRDPTPLDRVKTFKPFNCDYPVSIFTFMCFYRMIWIHFLKK